MPSINIYVDLCFSSANIEKLIVKLILAMFVRTKKSPNTPKTAVQIVENYRVNNKVKQKIIRHVGSATKEKDIENLQNLAQYIIVRMEVEESPQLSFFTAEELLKIIIESRKKKQQAQHLVDINNLREEKRVTPSWHETSRN